MQANHSTSGQNWPNRDPLSDWGSLAYLGPSFDRAAVTANNSAIGFDEFVSEMAQINMNPFGAMANNPLFWFDPFGLCNNADSLTSENSVPGGGASPFCGMAESLINQLAQENAQMAQNVTPLQINQQYNSVLDQLNQNSTWIGSMWNMQNLDTGWAGPGLYNYNGQIFSGNDLNYFGVGVGFAYNGIPPSLANGMTSAWHGMKHEGTSPSSAQTAMNIGYNMYLQQQLNADAQANYYQNAYSKINNCPLAP